MTAWQCCVGFCWTVKWISCKDTHLLPLDHPSRPLPPLQVITEHQAELHVLYGSFPLAVCFTQGAGYRCQWSCFSTSHFLLPPVAQLVKNLPAMWFDPGFDPWVGKMPWRRERLPAALICPGGFRGQSKLVGYSPWGREELGHDWVTSNPWARHT